jgi:hypothetical protein
MQKKPKERVPPKVAALRVKRKELSNAMLDMVSTHLHAAQEGLLGPDVPPEASAPPFPPLGGLSDVKLQLDTQIGADNRVATRWTVYATHSGTVGDYPATLSELTITGITYAVLSEDDDRVLSQTSFYDQPALVKQLKYGA